MPVAIFKSPIEVENRLDTLGTSRDLMVEVIDALAAAKADCTDNDPFGSRGWRGWQMGTRRMREVHVGLSDWMKDDTDQVPSIVSKRLRIRFVVCNTDDGTAIETRSPQNNSKKGAATDRAVDTNQLSFMDDLDEGSSVARLQRHETSVGRVITYYLCVHTDGDERRAELSCPVSVDGGFFGEFVERIFIIGGDRGASGPARRKSSDDDEGGAEYPIPVTRKK